MSALQNSRTAPFQPNIKGSPTFQMTGLDSDRSVYLPIEATATWEPHVLTQMDRIIQTDFICLDIGANLGPFTAAMSHLASDGRVHSFEASRLNFDLLKHNVESNGLRNVELHHYAVTDHRGTATLNYYPDLPGCSFLSSTNLVSDVAESVEAITLDDFMRSARLEKVNVIKMDIEGSEVKGLQGAVELFQNFKPVLFIEYNPRAMRDYHNFEKRELYDVLTGFCQQILVISRDDGELVQISSFEQLDRLLPEDSWQDLLCC